MANIISVIGKRPYIKSKSWAAYLAVIIIFLGISGNADAQKSPYNQVYQYSVMVGSSRAYLWIPPDCSYVRGVVIALNNLTERSWLEDPLIRKTASQEGLGIIWVGPPKNYGGEVLNTQMKPGSVEALTNMLRDFADVSGYSDIAYAPIIVTGHSAHGQFAWDVPNRIPLRVIAAIPIKTYPLPDSLDFKDVPLCYIVGQTTEWPEYRDGRKGDRDFFWPVVRKTALHLRERSNDNLVGVVVDPGGGHFDWSHHLAQFLALYIRKACKYRLPDKKPKDGPVHLKKISPQFGWLTDTGGMEPDTYQPMPYNQYKGDPQKAYWFFDKKTAMAAHNFEGNRKKRKKQMLTFVQDGKLLPVGKQGFAALKFEPGNDGMTFRLKGGFLKKDAA